MREELETCVSRDGVMRDGKAHPGVVEMRQQRIALARLLAALRLPAGEEGALGTPARRPQRRGGARGVYGIRGARSEEHTSELQSLVRISYAVFCLKKKNTTNYLHQYVLYYTS